MEPSQGSSWKRILRLGTPIARNLCSARAKIPKKWSAWTNPCVPYGTFEHCLEIKETTALEPDVIVHDFYAPGIGPVMSLESGERLELVQIVNK